MNKRALLYLTAASLTLAIAFLYVTFKGDHHRVGVIVENPINPDMLPMVTVKQGKLLGEPVTIEVKPNQPALLRVDSDITDEVHLHGEDITYLIEANKITTIELKSGVSGVFEMELHEAGVGVGVLKVVAEP